MRLGLVALAAAGLALGAGDRASAQVIGYNTPVYYTSPYTPLVRTYSTPVMYSTYTSPIVVPTRFTYPTWGTVAYDYPAAATGYVNAINSKPLPGTSAASEAASGVRPAGYVQPYPAFHQVGYSTYTNAALPIGGAAYSGDAFIPPSSYYYTPYPEYGSPATGFGPVVSNGYYTPYYQIQFAQGYGGWGMGRGWGGWGRGWGWGW